MKRKTYTELGVLEPEDGIIEFEVLPEHIKLLRSSIVCETETGSDIHPVRPFGTKNIYQDMATILEHDSSQEIYRDDYYKQLLNQLPLVHQIVLVTGKFKATKYRAQKYSMLWREYNPKTKKVKHEGQSSFDATEAK